MELCIVLTSSNLPHSRLFTSNNTHLLRWKTSLTPKQPSTNPGFLYCTNSSLRSTMSEETSNGASQYVREESVVTVEDVQVVEKNSYTEIAPEVPKESTSMDGQVQASEFLDKLDIKLDDSADGYSVLLFSGGALVSVWIAAVVVASIDSIPVLRKLMEVVGLGYSVWFGTRYLVFKKNREELAAKIDEIKQQVLGSNDD